MALQTDWDLTRRDLIKLGGAGAAATMLPSVVSACDSGGSSAGGDVSAAIVGKWVSFDPHVDTSDGGLSVIPELYESLYASVPDVKDDVQPQLADGEPEPAGENKYRIKLRDGMTFHDGSPVTARDFVASYDRIMDPKSESFLTRMFAVYTGARAVDEMTVEIETQNPPWLLKQRLALINVAPAGWLRSATERDLKNRPIGSAPFRLTSNTGNEAQLRQFKNYGGPQDVHLDSVRFTTITEDNARIAALESGRAQAIQAVPPQAYERLEDSANSTAKLIPGALRDEVHFNCGKPPFDDVRVRQAFLHAIDREALAKDVLFGHAEVAKSVLPSDHPNFVEPTQQYPYDPDRARALLKEAGQTRISFPLQFSQVGWIASQAELIQEQLRQVGMDTNLKFTETEAGYSAVLDGSYFAYITPADTTVLGGYDGAFLLRWEYYGVVPETINYWSGPEYNEIKQTLDRAETTTSEDEHQSLLGEVQNLVAENIPNFPLHLREVGPGWDPDTFEDFPVLSTGGLTFIGVEPA